MKSYGSRVSLFLILAFLYPAGVRSWALPAEDELGEPCVDQKTLRRAFEAALRQIPPGPPESPALPTIETDPQGRIWAAWEEGETGMSRIGIGRLDEEGRLERLMTADGGGFNYSPDLAFDTASAAWATWASWSDERGYRVHVQDLSSRRRWTFRLSADVTATGPKILLDREGRVWTFWNESSPGRWEIVFRVFEGNGWSPKESVVGPTPFPSVNPDIAVDDAGIISLVWAGYDGEDYEIYLRRRRKTAWSPAARITDNAENDLFPSLAAGKEDCVVGWLRSRGRENQLFASFYGPEGDGRETAVSPPSQEPVRPRLTMAGGRAAVVWKSEDILRSAEIRPERFTPRRRPVAPSPQPRVIFNPERDENLYLGFGDSITYGYIDRLPTPELGYPPRLRILLSESFGETGVINEGIGGETTVQGLARIDEVLEMWDARYILIMEGTNDVISNEIAMPTAAFNIGEIARRCREAGLFPTVTTIIPRRDALGTRTFFKNRLLTFNALVRELPAEMHISFIDMYDLFLNYPEEQGGLLAVLSNDLKHPSEVGYQFMAECWFGEIRNYPFPPVAIEIKDKRPEKDVGGGPRRRRPLDSGDPASSRERFKANLVSWADNPKIYDRTRVKGYRIFRRNKLKPASPFWFVALVEGATHFLDDPLLDSGWYEYLIAAFRDDDVEGPCGGPVDDR